MKKSDLRNMMIVELRNSARYIVVGDRLYNENGYMLFSAFTDDLKHANRTYESEDIVKVYAPINFLPTYADFVRVEQLCTLEWEREDDLDHPFNGKAVFTGQGQLSKSGYTVGKVYSFNDGKTTDDDGEERPTIDVSLHLTTDANLYLTERLLGAFGFLKLIE